MANLRQFRSLTLGLSAVALALAMVVALGLVASQTAQAQTFNVIHTFTGRQDGEYPNAGVTMDGAGNLYGTSFGPLIPGAPQYDGSDRVYQPKRSGSNRVFNPLYSFGGSACGDYGCGTVYKLKRSGSNWVFSLLYSFAGGSDGFGPTARVIFGPDGLLYGTTSGGGGSRNCGEHGCGTVFNLSPPPVATRPCGITNPCLWTETVLSKFAGYPADGGIPGHGDLIFDPAGNIYGTTTLGGRGNDGTVYELTPSGSGWRESVLYSFPYPPGPDGAAPDNGVILDNAGNLYGTTAQGGLYGYGTVFELSPTAGSGWTEKVLYSFQNGSDGGSPNAGLIFDLSGNLYGATTGGGSGGGGSVFELSPSGGGWTFTVLYSFTGTPNCGPVGTLTLVMDGAGNLYGTTECDGANNAGSVFKLTPSSPYWTYTSLHDFTGGSDGAYPISNVIFDAAGNLYGTTPAGGSQGVGVVWEITP